MADASFQESNALHHLDLLLGNLIQMIRVRLFFPSKSSFTHCCHIWSGVAAIYPEILDKEGV